MLTTTGASLQAYFMGQGFAADKSATNIVLPDGALMLFRGSDAQGRTIVLTMAGAVRKGDKPQQTQITPQILSIAYAENPVHPDVFQLPKGAF